MWGGRRGAGPFAAGSRLEKGDADRERRFSKRPVVRCEWQGAPDGEFQVRRVVGGQALGPHQVEDRTERTGGNRFVQDEIRGGDLVLGSQDGRMIKRTPFT